MNSEGRAVLDELSNLIESLTTSGNPSLDQELFKRVKNICKSSDENVHHLYRMVTSQLEKRHAEIRLSSLQIVKEIFSRSHVFRELLIDDFQHFLELTVGTNADSPPPEPANVATTLKTQSFQAIEQWHEKYGSYYKKLALGYKYLKRVKKFEFDGVRSRTALERQRTQETEARRSNVAQQKLNIVLTQMEESTADIENITTEMENCLRLLLPRPEEFDIYKEAVCERNEESVVPRTSSSLHLESQEKICYKTNDPSQNIIKHGSENILNQYGFGSHSYPLNITVSTLVEIVETQDNTDILNTLNELEKQVRNKYLPMIQKWLDVLTKHSVNNEKLIQAIDLRNSLTELKQKFKKLKIISIKNSANTCASKDVLGQNSFTEEDENELEEQAFVDVPEKEEIEHIPECERHEYGLEPLECSSGNSPGPPKDQNIVQKFCSVDAVAWDPNGTPRDSAEFGDPCSRATALAAFAQKKKQKGTNANDKTIIQNSLKCFPSSEKKDPNNLSTAKNEKHAELLRKAPVVPFDMDLYNWGRPDDEAPSVSNLKSLHCFWVHGNDENEDHCPGDIKESLKTRSITFGGKFQEIKWACRAPLTNGKLCPRRDRYKCPFHGKIIPRDKMGQPSGLDPEGVESLNRKADAGMEEVTRAVELATGLDLSSARNKKSRKRKHPGLTDLKKSTDTSRSRLEKIVFDKSSLQRVTSEIDRVRKKLIDEKFGNNWNYALSQ